MSDFYGLLQIMDMQLNKIKSVPGSQYTKLADNLQSCINERKKSLIANPLMRCAMFLDPRYKCDIDSDKELVIFVKLTLENLWKRIKSVKNIAQTTEVPSQTEVRNKSSDNMNDFFAELDNEYNTMMLENGAQSLSLSQLDFSKDKSDIAEAINEYEKSVAGSRMKSSACIHQFWEQNKENFGLELYEIASTIFAIPPTQAAVERYFSAMKYLFDVYRYNLSEDLLECCMLINLNPDFFNIVKQKNITRVINDIQKG